MGGTESTEIKLRGTQPPFPGCAPVRLVRTEALVALADTDTEANTANRVNEGWLV